MACRVRAKVRGSEGAVCDMEQLYKGMRSCPSLHIIGDRDPVKRVRGHCEREG